MTDLPGELGIGLDQKEFDEADAAERRGKRDEGDKVGAGFGLSEVAGRTSANATSQDRGRLLLPPIVCNHFLRVSPEDPNAPALSLMLDTLDEESARWRPAKGNQLGYNVQTLSIGDCQNITATGVNAYFKSGNPPASSVASHSYTMQASVNYGGNGIVEPNNSRDNNSANPTSDSAWTAYVRGAVLATPPLPPQPPPPTSPPSSPPPTTVSPQPSSPSVVYGGACTSTAQRTGALSCVSRNAPPPPPNVLNTVQIVCVTVNGTSVTSAAMVPLGTGSSGSLAPTGDAPGNDNGATSTNIGLIAGVAGGVGGLLLIVIIIIGAVLYNQRRAPPPQRLGSSLDMSHPIGSKRFLQGSIKMSPSLATEMALSTSSIASSGKISSSANATIGSDDEMTIHPGQFVLITTVYRDGCCVGTHLIPEIQMYQSSEYSANTTTHTLLVPEATPSSSGDVAGSDGWHERKGVPHDPFVIAVEVPSQERSDAFTAVWTPRQPRIAGCWAGLRFFKIRSPPRPFIHRCAQLHL
ncbi:hypothetical protein M427DRAFT_31095 [Gonapodya prolifera JEL478]|uniref:Uncharacterized protein n=1 Tax=Gonapodya prolifera (strain JEL478) TaxID=1344416 RepID=A0A139AIT3_GONPJ|nr:hypothetical protein M427DRAFT_31095 [Gonapodya prolifera JEL478]|eukprot:KXS16697.1 hypothetical protein M427DRAFT_31095 [Gonapodya prolifera JEL478]